MGCAYVLVSARYVVWKLRLAWELRRVRPREIQHTCSTVAHRKVDLRVVIPLQSLLYTSILPLYHSSDNADLIPRPIAAEYHSEPIPRQTPTQNPRYLTSEKLDGWVRSISRNGSARF